MLDILREIGESESQEQIRKISERRYTSNEINSDKTKLRKGIKYKSPSLPSSNYKILNDKQLLIKNKIISKLKLLEQRGGMPPIIPNTSKDNLLIVTIGSAFSSLEQIHYGDIAGDSIINVTSEEMDIIALIQQIQDIDEGLVKDLKQTIINYIVSGAKVDVPEKLKELNNYKIKDDIDIEKVKSILGTEVDYEFAKDIIQKFFYLVKANAKAKQCAIMLSEITKYSSKYIEIIEYIKRNGFCAEPEIITRQSKKGIRLSESVSLNLKQDERELIYRITKLSEEEQFAILQNGGILNIRNILKYMFSKKYRIPPKMQNDYYYDFFNLEDQVNNESITYDYSDYLTEDNNTYRKDFRQKTYINRFDIKKKITQLEYGIINNSNGAVEKFIETLKN